MSSGSKCFSQVNTPSFAINLLKSWSITLVFVISLSQSSLHFMCPRSLLMAASIFQYSSSFCMIHSPKLHNFHLAWPFLNYFAITLVREKLLFFCLLCRLKHQLVLNMCAGLTSCDRRRVLTTQACLLWWFLRIVVVALSLAMLYSLPSDLVCMYTPFVEVPKAY